MLHKHCQLIFFYFAAANSGRATSMAAHQDQKQALPPMHFSHFARDGVAPTYATIHFQLINSHCRPVSQQANLSS